MGAYSFPKYVRISIGTAEETQHLTEALQKTLGLS
jgi:histidinol-phosphate/aromatic aminotransferase/cobyric acid decarboxylase-like protein